MTTVINHKRGATFTLGNIKLLDLEGASTDLTDYVIDSQIRTPCGKLVADLDVDVAGDNLSLTLGKLDTSDWPVTGLVLDVRYVAPNGVVRFSETLKVQVIEAITRD